MDQIASDLALDLVPMGWPVGMGTDFRGVSDLADKKILLPESERARCSVRARRATATPLRTSGRSPASTSASRAGRSKASSLRKARCRPSISKSFREGHLSPVFFGSALKNFGVEQLLDALGQWAPAP